MRNPEHISRRWRGDEPTARLDRAIDDATHALVDAQRADGHWVFELEADSTISSEYIALLHFLGERDPALEARIARYLRRRQGAHGGWPLTHGGPFDISASVKAYYALKLAGDSPDAPHMRRAREAILAHGGAGTANVFTRILLALHGVLDWKAVPVVPVELMLFPKWSPFHLSRVSYWTRTVLVPLLVLQARKPRARNPLGVRIDELFPNGRPHARRWMRAPHQARLPFAFFAFVDALLHVIEPLVPTRTRERAIDRAVSWVNERANGEDGLGAIFPAMANAVMMYDTLGYARDREPYATARRAIDKLLVVSGDEAYCQPCVSPVWDTALACHALLDIDGNAALSSVRRGLSWLVEKQVLSVVGDWSWQRPDVRPGGWAFQYENPHYPDLDDTAVVVMAIDRYTRLRGVLDEPMLFESMRRANEWVVGMQSGNGGFGAFDADNTSEYLNHIPFADHGALLDPPTADVTARCASMMAQLGAPEDRDALSRALAFLQRSQEPDGSWYGRWGMNYVYGTWSALCALACAGVPSDSTEVRMAVRWLESVQNEDGGWGETAETYALHYAGDKRAPSTPSQTAWALLGLMAAGEAQSPVVARGVEHLLRTQGDDGFWPEPEFTATGFPRVFFLRYHGYAKFFPAWALARYRAHMRGTMPRMRLGM
ncbi:MAG TPA: squalene--hopene cyclase [Casimicrobiaceae bacterium]|nr:squalene--hopene cyclase [Casimicrobiaceae bacterium]